MKKLLITGFTPFGGDLINPSWEIVSHFPEEIEGVEIFILEVPVIYEKAVSLLIKKAEEIEADGVICLGYNAKAHIIELEYVALNLQHTNISDQDGYMPKNRRIDPDGPLARQTRLPIFEIANDKNRDWLPAKISLSAGSYVCNDVMYRLLAWCEKYNKLGGFIHVPPFEELWQRGMKQEDAYKTALEVIRQVILLEKDHY